MECVLTQLERVAEELNRVAEELKNVKTKLDPLEDMPRDQRTDDDKEDLKVLRDERKQLRETENKLREKENKLLDRQNLLMRDSAQTQKLEREFTGMSLSGQPPKTVRSHGFRPLTGIASVSAAPPSTSSHFPVAEIVEGVFRSVSFEALPPVSPDVGAACWASDNKQPLQWASEADIGYFVRRVMEDIFQELGLKSSMVFVAEVKKFFTKPDFFLKVQGPVGAIEVKKPYGDDSRRGSILADAGVLGEVFDQLMHLKNEWMVAAPFVLVTSYNEWRVCWLNDDASNALAAKECVFASIEQVHPEVSTPAKAGERKSPESSPERHFATVSLGEVRDEWHSLVFETLVSFTNFYLNRGRQNPTMTRSDASVFRKWVQLRTIGSIVTC
jgi:hypothetical protein